MTARALRRYVSDLLAGRRPTPFRPDEFQAAQIRTAIELRAARLGGDAPRQQFLTDLHRRLAAQMTGAPSSDESTRALGTTRRQVIVGTSAAAAAAGAAVTADRLLAGGPERPNQADTAVSGGELVPSDGGWQVVAASSDVPDAVMRPFEHDSLIGFVRRVNGRVEAVSGVCTHQGCRLWFDQPDDRLRCPCHSTSFAPTGQLLTHQLPIGPRPLPHFQVREVNGAIEVLAPSQPPAQRT
jgi:cytochrome b6-f complex iron-sulfur subunit